MKSTQSPHLDPNRNVVGMDEREQLTVNVIEAARRLGIGIGTAREMVRDGRLRAIHVGAKGGKARIPVNELQEFLAREAGTETP
jgi:excisionase family DNA binding protein